MSQAPIKHPSEIWEWYKEGKRHPCGSVAFVAWPDHVAALKEQALELKKARIEIEMLREQREKNACKYVATLDHLQNLIQEQDTDIEAAKAKVE